MNCFICAHGTTLMKCSETIRRDNAKVSEIITQMIGPTCIVNISETDEICDTCIILLENFYDLSKKVKILQKLLLRQVRRAYNIDDEENYANFDVDHQALRAFTKTRKNEFSCKHCTYKTKFKDTIAPHFLLHNRDYDISNEFIENDDPERSDEEMDIEAKLENIEELDKIDNVSGMLEANHINDFSEKSSPASEIPSDESYVENNLLRPLETNLKIENLSENEDEIEILYDEEVTIKTEIEEYNEFEAMPQTFYKTITQIEPLDEFVDEGSFSCAEEIFCAICQKTWFSDNAYVEHMKMDHLTCCHCDKVYKDRRSIIRHFKFVHEGVILTCDLCSVTYKSKNGFLKHFKRHVGTETWQCPYCDRSFWEKTNYSSHVSQHTNTSNYVCDLCGKTFTSASTHRLHMRYHETPTPFKCKYCPKAYASASSLAIHRRKIHTGEILYKCEFCDKGFASKGTYKIHRIQHVPEYPYNCTKCQGKGFIKKRDFARHMKNFHNDGTYLITKTPEYKIAIRPEIEI